MKSLEVSALGWGAGSSGAYVNFLMASRTEFLEYSQEVNSKPFSRFPFKCDEKL